jgi:hypothetical protein
VDHHVGSELERALAEQPRPGAVDDRGGADLVGDLRDLSDVADRDQWISRRLDIDDLVSGRIASSTSFGIGGVDQADLDSKRGR